VTSVYTLLDTMILGLMVDKAAVGYYTTALRLVKLVIALLVAVSTVMVATLSFRIHRGDREEAVLLLRKSFALTSLVGVPLSVGLFIVAPNVVLLFAGGDFKPAVAALRFLAPTILMIGLSNIFGMQVLNITNNERLFLRAALAGMAISIAANLLLIPGFRSTGSAMANALTEAVVCTLLAVFALKKFPFRPEWMAIAKAMLSALPMPLIWWLLKQISLPEWSETIVMVALAGSVYFAIQRFVWRNPLVGELATSSLSFLSGQTKAKEGHG